MQFAYMHILVHIEDQIVELVDTDDSRITGHGVVKASGFKIKAVSLGTTTLYVSLLLPWCLSVLCIFARVNFYRG